MRKRKPGSKQGLKKMVSSVVKKAIQAKVEHKHLTVTLNTSASTTPTYGLLSTIGQGTTDILRIGDEIRPYRLKGGYLLAVADTTNIVRVIIFSWKQNSTPADSTVFDDSGNVHGLLIGPFSRDTMNGRMMVVHYDKTHALSGVSSPNQRHHVNIALRSKINFVGGSSTASFNGLYICYVSDSSAVTHPVIQYTFDLDFTDA